MGYSSIYLHEYKPISELATKQSVLREIRQPIIDIHGHFGLLAYGPGYEERYDTGRVVENLKMQGISKVVNLDGFWEDEFDRIMKKIHPYEDFIITFGAVDIRRLEEAGFKDYVRKTIHNQKEKGMKGLKFWKNISLELMDSNGAYICVDDDRLDVVWKTAAELDLPVLIHIADPVAFFKPIDKYNERFEELLKHPDWSFCDPKYYRFEQLMQMQENMVAKNPETTFIVAHVGSNAENLSHIAYMLDKYKNFNIDIADRISELGRQPYTSKKFFEAYQDRIFFGTDMGPGFTNYKPYFRFLETYDEYFDYSSQTIPPQGRWKIYGIGLEESILDKIYYKNAAKLLG